MRSVSTLVVAVLLVRSGTTFSNTDLCGSTSCNDLGSLVQLPSTPRSLPTAEEGVANDAVKTPLEEPLPPASLAEAERLPALATCRMSESEACLMSGMRGPTLVAPRNGTQCLTGDPYSFLVIPGRSRRLLLLFQGDRACWEAHGVLGKVVVQKCVDNIQAAIDTSGLGTGIQNTSRKENPFRDYTIVNVLYCTGDVHIGSSTMTNASGTVLIQQGYRNARAAVDWAKANTLSPLRRLTITGYSAGAVGAMVWADTLLTEFSFQSAAVLLDSYVGFFPPGMLQHEFRRCGACEFLLREQCERDELTPEAVLANTMWRHPDVAFASVQSKVDFSQIAYYKAFARSWGFQRLTNITDAQFYADTVGIMQRWNAFPNYVVYFVDGQQHGFTNLELFYTASVAGPTQQAAGFPALAQWTLGVLQHSAQSACFGNLVEKPPRGTDVTWCAAALLPKSLEASRPSSAAVLAAQGS